MRLRGLRYLLRDERFERPTRRDLVTFGGYVLCGAVYLAIGVAVTDFLLSFWVALAYILVTAWLVPLVVRRVL